MARHVRLDAPDVPHHGMVRRIERRVMVRDEGDRADFVGRRAALVPAA